jgi:solute:Na+ symporter, SSS family
MNMPLFISLLFGLQFLYWIVGRQSSKNLKGNEDYFLAGKTVQIFPLMMTFLATQVGGGLVLGAADEAYTYGWGVLFYPLGQALGLILLGLGIGKKLAGFNVSTVAQIFEVVYKSATLKKIASVLSVISLFMILIAQIIASSKFLVSIGFDNVPLFIIFWGIVIIYTAQGGLKAVISTDLIQAAFFSTVFLLCFGFVLYSYPLTSLTQLQTIDYFIPYSSKMCGWLLMPLLFMVVEQDMAQRCFAGASTKIVSRACLLAGISTILVCIAPVYFGCLAKINGYEILPGSSVLMTTIMQTTSPWITAVVGCAVLAAIISTATSLINAISSNLSTDFDFSFLKKIESIKVAQGMTCLISIGAIFFAFFFDNIVDVLIQSYELALSCLLVPVAFALYKKQGNALSAYAAIFLGAAGFIAFKIYPIEFPKEIASILLSLTGYSLAEIFLPVSTSATTPKVDTN